MKTINRIKRWVAVIALSMLSPACTHETNNKPPPTGVIKQKAVAIKSGRLFYRKTNSYFSLFFRSVTP
jgi:hypothetical protein